MKDHFTLHKDKLKGEYLETFDKIQLYGLSSRKLDSDVYEEQMMDLVDMFITAQENNKPVRKIVGNDVEGFCKSYFEHEHYTFRENVRKLPKRYITLAWTIFILELLELIIGLGESEENLGFFDMKTDIGPYLLGIFIGFVIISVLAAAIKPLIFKVKWLSLAKVQGFMILILVAGAVFISLSDVELSLEVPLWLVLFISGAYIAVYHSVNAYFNYQKYGKLRKPKDETKVSFWGQISEDIERELPGELKKRFEKKNKKLAKKGKPLMTPVEYMEELRKEVKWESKGNYVGAVLVFFFCLGISSSEMINSSVIDGCILFVILMVVEIPIWIWFTEGAKGKGYKFKVLEKCDKLGITVIEYADGLENGTIAFEREESGENEEEA